MQKKIFMYIMTVLIITSIISVYFTVQTIQDEQISGVEKKLLSEAYILSQMVAQKMQIDDIKSLNYLLADISKNLQVRITIIDNLGKVLTETSYDPTMMGSHLERPEVQKALMGETGTEIRFSETMKINFMYVTHPIYIDNSIAGIVRISSPMKEIQGIMRGLNSHLFIALIPGLILSLLLVYRISVSITRPIKDIKNAAVDITHGKLDTELSVISRDEIGELAKAIDFMAVSLKEKINSIKEENTKMEAILSSVANGIIAVDGSKKILFINTTAEKMLNISDKNVSGKFLLEVIRNNEIDNMVKDILENQSFEEKEISLNYPEEMIYRLYSNTIKHPESNKIIGIIIIIQDITEIKRLERMRSEFVANVSHELKTPLTSIKGFVETLKAGAIEDITASERFLNIIDDEADRLYRLITDILSLSELENRRYRPISEKIDTFEVIEEIVSMLQNQAAKKRINLSAKVDESISCLYGDPDQFKQMLINLIDNAVKYTPEEGTVAVAAYNFENAVIIKIIDNGIGISKEHIPRLFERFYRVDKARSRNVGGTGLGLAIVKHIVKLFKGSIEVNSEVGKGTEFTLNIPIIEEV